MISFTSYASSSKGNLYTLSDPQETILIECGLPIKEIKKALNFKLSDISFCLLSHLHADHSRAIKDIMKVGIDVYTSQGTIDGLGLKGHRVHAVQPGKQLALGKWIVLPVETQHDAPEPLGFLIYNRDTREKMLFATDTFYLKNTFSGLNIIAVECNYSAGILAQNVSAGLVPTELKKRLLRSHFEMSNVKKFLLANDLSQVKEIYLIHLSEINSNAELFKSEIQKITGKVVIVCDS